MKKILGLLVVLLGFLPLSVKAETLMGFLDNKYYNLSGELRVFGFLDGKYYNIEGQEVIKVGGNFIPEEFRSITASSTPQIGEGISTSLPATSTPIVNIIIPQSAIIPPDGSSNPLIIKKNIMTNVCPNLSGDHPTLPEGLVLSGNECVSQDSITPTIATNLKVPIKPYILNITIVPLDSQYPKGLVKINADIARYTMPKIEYSLNADMSDSKMQLQDRDEAGNTLDICPYGFPELIVNRDLQLTPKENLLPNTKYYFRIKSYQCGLPNVSPWQFYLGQTEIMSFTTKD